MHTIQRHANIKKVINQFNQPFLVLVHIILLLCPFVFLTKSSLSLSLISDLSHFTCRSQIVWHATARRDDEELSVVWVIGRALSSFRHHLVSPRQNRRRSFQQILRFLLLLPLPPPRRVCHHAPPTRSLRMHIFITSFVYSSCSVSF